MAAKKLHRWYKDVLSGFKQAEEQGEIGVNDIEVYQDGELTRIAVPIVEQEHLGVQMAIDEKTIDGTCYTILSNRQTNKIALMAATLKTEYLMQIITKHFDIERRMQVKSLSRDMAENYDWLGREVFMNAYHVIDKFHIIKNMMEQLQAIRIRYRQEELAKRRKAKENKQIYPQVILSNGDTILQLLARSRGLLFIPPNKWSDHQKQRAKLLFEHYPEIKTAYLKVMEIRRWFNPPKGKTTYKKTRDRKRKELKKLLDNFTKSTIEEIVNIAYTFKSNMGQILNYFIRKETNAKAEALNRNLQRFINVNYGARNTQYFLYRVKIHFA
ncbi:MAG: transposase [Winogradskyella sp.]|nr:transposase [Winogradskyella sp.]